jgi:prepilin-type N-terminal cleavage/methylation domain-containing protein
MKRTDRLNQRRRVTAFGIVPNLSERGCVEDQPQQADIVQELEKVEPALVCGVAAAGALPPSHSRAPAKSAHVTAFTLIELLVVIAIIGILAALVFPVVGVVNRNKQLAVAKTQLQQIQQDIEGYHTKLGYYPPDNPTNVVCNPLYYELMGTTNNQSGGTPATFYATLDGSAQATTAQLTMYFGVTGIANTSTRAHSDDTGSAAQSYLTHLLPNQVGKVDDTPPNQQVLVLVCPVSWPGNKMPPPLSGMNAGALNPWRYNSSHPTNNTGSFDLWVDLVIGNKTNRICNWSANPIQL